MRKLWQIIVLLLFAPSVSALNLPQVNMTGDIDLRDNSVWNGTVNGTNFLNCNALGQASSWNGSWFDCIAVGGVSSQGLFETISNKSTDTALGTSNILYPTQKAVKDYVDAATSTLNATVFNNTVNGSLMTCGDSCHNAHYVNYSIYNVDLNNQQTNNSNQETEIAGKQASGDYATNTALTNANNSMNSLKLNKTEQAADSAKLNGQSAAYYQISGNYQVAGNYQVYPVPYGNLTGVPTEFPNSTAVTANITATIANITANGKLTNVSAGSNVNITWSNGVAQINSTGVANETTWNVEVWIMGNDNDKNFTMNYTFVPNSSEVYINGISKDLFRDYNESGQNISVTAPLSYLDEVKVKYAKQ